MPELTLLPVAAKLKLRAQDERPVPDWPQVLREFVAAVAARVGSGPQRIIGHIKGMVQMPGHLLRVNCVSAQVPVETTGELPDEVREITLEIMLLVYGLDSRSAGEAIAAAAAEVQQKHGCTVQQQSAGSPDALQTHK